MAAEIERSCWPAPNGGMITIALRETGLPDRVRLVDTGAGEVCSVAGMARRLDAVGARPAVQRGRAVALGRRTNLPDGRRAQEIRFGRPV